MSTERKPGGGAFNMFARPTNGASFMYEIGSQPYDSTVLPRPNQTTEEALEEIKDMFTSSVLEKENLENVVSVLDAGVPPQIIAKDYLTSLNMYGHINTDLAELCKTNIAMQCGFIGEKAGIKMNIEEDDTSKINQTKLHTAINRKNKELKKEEFDKVIEGYESSTSPVVTKQEEVKEDKKPSGLMSRAVLEDEDIPDVDANNEVLV